jgi:hypothetical protein
LTQEEVPSITMESTSNRRLRWRLRSSRSGNRRKTRKGGIEAAAVLFGITRVMAVLVGALMELGGFSVQVM